jgi:hypothetical protein
MKRRKIVAAVFLVVFVALGALGIIFPVHAVAAEPAVPVPAEPLPVKLVPANPLPVKPVPAKPLPVKRVPVEPLPLRPVPAKPVPYWDDGFVRA